MTKATKTKEEEWIKDVVRAGVEKVISKILDLLGNRLKMK